MNGVVAQVSAHGRLDIAYYFHGHLPNIQATIYIISVYTHMCALTLTYNVPGTLCYVCLHNQI